MKSEYNLLMIDPNPSDVRNIEEILSGYYGFKYSLKYNNNLSDGLESLKKYRSGFDALLVDLKLPDSNWLSALEKLRTSTINIPIIILTNLLDEETAVKAVHLGAQDYLIKGKIDCNLLVHSILYSIERNKLLQEMKQGRLHEQRIRLILELSLKSFNIEKLLARALDLILSVISSGDEAGCLISTISDDNSLVPKIERGLSRDFLANCRNHSPGMCICGKKLPVQKISFCTENIDFISEKPDASYSGGHYAVPIFFGDKILGMINIFFAGRHYKNKRDEDFLVSVADALAVTIEHKNMEQKLKALAFYDTLTGIPNRSLLVYRMNNALERAKMYGQKLGVLFIDLDRFKSINDSLGHDAGDILLKKVAGRLKSCIRNTDVAARLSGDEFVILLPEISNQFEASEIAMKIINSLDQPFRIKNNQCLIGSSIGISLFPKDGGNSNVLISNADTAMYYAKSHGRNGFRFYSEEMNKEALRFSNIDSSLNAALENQEFVLYYQPAIDIKTKKAVIFESLLRWKHPEKGLLYPNDFIGIAEKTGLIARINEWVLDKACAELLTLKRNNIPPVRFSLNISGFISIHPEQLKVLKNILLDRNLSAEYLELELSESFLINQSEQFFKDLKEISRMGVTFAVNDFGSEYGSLKCLCSLPFSTIKINKDYVKKITADPEIRSIVKNLILIGHMMNLKVIGQGVETTEQSDLLGELSCDYIQGFLICKPQPIYGLMNFLTENTVI